MQGSWTLRPCPHGEVQRLVAELGLHEVTAAVLVRRGYGDPDTARAFLAADAPGHDPFLPRRHGAGGRTHPARGRAGRADLRPRRLRRRRDLRHGPGRARPPQPRRGGRLAPAEPVRRGLRRQLHHDRAPRGRGLRPRRHGGLRDHGREGGRRGEGARPRRRRHRPPPAGRRAARLPRRRDAAVRLPLPGALRHGRGGEARRGAGRRRDAAPRPRRARHHRGRRPAARREPLLRGRGPPRARPDAEAGPARADAVGARRPCRRRLRLGRLPARAADQRGRPARAPRRCARPDPHRGRGGVAVASLRGSRS